MLRMFYWIPCSEETFRIKYTDRHVLKPHGADEICTASVSVSVTGKHVLLGPAGPEPQLHGSPAVTVT